MLDLFTDMTRGHTAYVDRRLLHLELHSGQGSILAALAQHGPKTQKELAELRRVSPATISVMVSRMVRDGLVERVPAEEGGKAVVITLTPKGEDLARRLDHFMEGEFDKIFHGLSPEELAMAQQIFTTIRDNLAKL